MKTRNRSRVVHHTIRSCLLSGFAIFILYLAKQDVLAFYVEPRMVPAVAFSGWVMAAMALDQMRRAVLSGVRSGQRPREDPSCGCQEPPPLTGGTLLFYLLFLLPLLLGVSFWPHSGHMETHMRDNAFHRHGTAYEQPGSHP